MKKHTRNTRGPGAWVLGGVASVLMCVSAFGQYVATQSTPITIPDSGIGTPYPSTIDLTKSNILGTIEKVSVTVNNLTHPYAPDIGLLLVGPNGKGVVLMSNSGGNPGGSAALNNVTLVFSDDASSPLPISSPLVSGSSYKPTDNGSLDLSKFPGGGPGSPYATSLNGASGGAFLGLIPNGKWSLYVVDTTPGPSTTLSPVLGSWSLSFQTTPVFTVITDSLTSVSNVFGGNVLSTFVQENSSVTVNLALQDSSTPVGTLTVSGTKISDLATNFSSSVSGATGSLTITPNAFFFGTNTLTITVDDGIGSTTTNITLAVLHINQAPTIALSTNSLTIAAGFMTTNLVVASLTDADTNFNANAVAKLTLTASSSDSTVVAPAGVFFTNLTAGGEQRGITIVPAGAGHGTATVTISVDDGAITNSQTITVTVLPAQYPIFANAAAIAAPANASGSSTIVIPANTFAGLVGQASVFINGLQGVVPSSSTFTLTAPDNTTVTLLQNNAASSSPRNYGQLLFVDGAGGTLPSADNVTNTISLAPAPGHLSSLVGVNPNGTWKLTLNNAAGTAAQILDGWTLNIFAAPSISGLPATVNGNEGQTLTVNFTVGDMNGTVTNVTGVVQVTPGLAKITGSVSGNNATLTIAGTQYVFGTNTVQVTVMDNNGFTATGTFTLGLAFVDNPPVVDFISRHVVSAGGVLGPITFKVTDPDQQVPVTFSIRGTSDNQKLIPDSNIQILTNSTGNPSTYTVTIYPVGTQSGSANITLIANDGTLAGQSTFNVFVQAPDFPLFAFTGGITINAGGAGTAPGTPYAATNVVSGLIGNVENVKVTLFGVNDLTPGNLKVLLVAPNNANVLLMGDVGGSFAVSATTLVFDDAASGSLVANAQIISGTYKPSANSQTTVAFPSPAPAPNYGTALSTFQGINPNGNWQLYVVDTGSTQKGSIAGGYQLSIQTRPSIPAIKDQYTTVNVSTNVPITIGDNQPGADVTVTATVTAGPNVLYPITNITVSGSTAVLQINPLPYTFGTNTITVVAKDAANNTAQNTFTMNVAFAPQPPLFTTVPADQSVPAATQLGPLAVSVFSPQGSALTVTASSLDNPGLIPSVQVVQGLSSGSTNNYTLTLIPAGVATGTATITIQAGDGSLKSSATFVVTVTPNLAFANTGSIAIPPGPTTPGQLQQGEATPYPSLIPVKGLGGVVSSVQVALVGLNHQHPEDLDILLVAPDNSTAVMLMAHAGSGAAANGLRLTFSDAANNPVIPPSGALSSQSYKVADYSGGLTLPAPAAVRPYKTTLSGFNGINPNGNWQLYVLDDTYPTGGSIDNGWILYLQTAPGIVGIGSQTTPENTPLAVPLTLSDASTDPTNLTVQVVTVGLQHPPDLVDPTNLVVTGTGANRTLTITPFLNYPSAYNILNNYSNAPGTNLIQVTVTDTNNNLPTVTSFPLTVTYVNQSPTIATATNAVYFDENTSGDTISYTVGDVDSYVFMTNVVATSSSQGLIANSNIVVALQGGGDKIAPGDTGTVTVTLKPNANVYGTATLSLVSGDLNTTTTNLVAVTINHIWQQPTIVAPVSPQPVIAGSSTTNIAFTVGSVEVDPKNLLVYASSDNTSLVPNSPANIIIGGSGTTRTIQLFTIAYSSQPVSAQITLVVTDKSLNKNSTNSIPFTLNATPVNTTFANTAAITTSGAGKANVYPSTVAVGNMVGATFKVDVILPNFSHSTPANLDVLLVEEGTNDLKTNAVVLMSSVGGSSPVSNLRLQFDDSGLIPPPNFLASGTYAPADYSTGLILPSPAPTNTSWSGTLSKAFAGLNPNGYWKLYVNDRGAGDVGNIATGWQLVIQTAPTIALADGTQSPLPITENNSGNVTINLQDMFIDTTNVTVTAASDNQSLIPNRNVTFGKITSSGFNGTVYSGNLVATITPATLQSGTANVTFTVTRSDGATASVKLPVTVGAINVKPTISRLDDIAMPENSTSNVTFIVSDVDTPQSSLSVKATSDNQSLIPSTSLVFQGYGTNNVFGLPGNNGPQSSVLVVTVTPVLFEAGSANVTITVTDPMPAGTNVIVSTFNVQVQTVTFPPFFIAVPKDQSVAANNTLSGIGFAVASPVASASTITNVATSSDQSLIKNANIHITQDASGTNRLISLTAENTLAGGTATITIVIGDPNISPGGTATAKFNVRVGPTRVINASNSHIINIIDNSPADLYPSQVVVSNLVGPIGKITATLNGFTHSFASDVGVLLVSPQGQKIVLMNNLATGRPGPTNVNLTFDQLAAGPIPPNVPLITGSYQPSDNSGGRVFVGVPAPYTNTLNAFAGVTPNGTWSLYVEDFVLGDAGAISNGWTLGITTLPVINGLGDIVTNENESAVENFTVADDNTNNTSFTFTASSDNANVVTNKGIVVTGSGTNYTITVNPVPNAFGSANITVSMVNGDGQTVNKAFKATFNQQFYAPFINNIVDQTTFVGTSATVPITYGNIGYNQNQLVLSFQSSNPNLVPVRNIKLSGSGNSLLISPAGVQTGSSLITVTVTNPNSQSTNTSFTLNVAPSSTPVFAQTQPITISDNSAATPYPSTLTVAGLAGNISKVTASVVGLSHSYPSDVSMLLVGPQGQSVVLMSRAGGSVGISNTRLDFDDSAATPLPQFSLIVDGAYQPTDYKSSDTFFPVVPPAPYGHALSVFNGTNPNGTWALYVQDDQAQNSGVINGGWVLNITTTGPIISPVIQSVTTPENMSTNIAFTVNSTSVNPSNLVATVSHGSDSIPGLIASLTLGGSGTSRSLLITPGVNLPSLVTNVDGTSSITLSVTDGTLTNSIIFPLTVSYVNQAPTITGLSDQTTAANVPFKVNFTVADVDTALSNLVVAASTSDPLLGTAAVSGANGAETLAYQPTGAQGVNTVSVTVSDGVNTTTNTFQVTLTNGLPPVVGFIPSVDVVNSSAGTTVKVNFTVDSGPLGTTNLSVVATADNTTLVPLITVTGDGTNFTAALNVAPSQQGVAHITVFARDEYGIGTNTFTVTVTLQTGAAPTLKLSATGNQLVLSFVGAPNASYAIQSSSDLKTWTTVTTITANASGAASYTATISASNTLLFYRSKSL